MNVKEMVKTYLAEHGFDGLFDEDLDCGCELGDLCPCGADFGFCGCEAGYKVMCTPDCEHEFAYGAGDWHIHREKPAEGAKDAETQGKQNEET